MDLEGIILSEISHTEKDKDCMISFICEIHKRERKRNKDLSRERTDWWSPEVREGRT